MPTAAEASFLVRRLLGFVAVGALSWVLAVAVSHGGVWYLLFIPLVPLALFELTFGSWILWRWRCERRTTRGHS